MVTAPTMGAWLLARSPVAAYASFVPNHGTREPHGPNMEQVRAAIDVVMKTGQVVAFAIVSVYGEGQGNQVSIASGIELIRSGLESWRLYGLPALAPQ